MFFDLVKQYLQRIVGRILGLVLVIDTLCIERTTFFPLVSYFKTLMASNLFLAYYFWWQKEKHCKNQCNTLRMIFQQFIQQLHRHFLRSVLLYWMFDKCGNQSFVHAHGLSTGTDYSFLFIYLFLNHTALKYSS